MIELTSNHAQLSISPVDGGRISSLRVFDNELLVQRDPNALLWGCYVMAPWAGRLAYGKFEHAGARYQTPINFAPHSIHGTTWYREWSVTQNAQLQIDLGDDWPFPGKVTHSFSLTDDGLRMELELHAVSQDFPASMGWHPWFQRVVGGRGAAKIDFNAREMLEVDAEHIPTGRTVPPSSGPWDDCFTGLRDGPRIAWPGVLELTLKSSAENWILYTEPEHAFCIEPQTAIPDSLNSKPVIVEPGSPLKAWFELGWKRLAADG